MTPKSFLKAALCATALTALAPLAMAQDKSGENALPTAEADGGAVEQAAMAQDLFAYAQANKNALAALSAAQIMMSLTIEDVEREKETQDNEGEAVAEEGEGTDMPIEAADMLAAAKDYAAGDEALMGIIEDVEAEGARGRIGGASRTLSRLRAGKTDIFKEAFYGGRLAELAIIGDGDADLDLVVTDENGNVICLDRSYSDKLYCSWTPAWDGYFYVAVKNQGRIRNSYYILTN
ncbi:hypothetical protein [Mesobacterium pallidum]|uniref:hypothetical protein n=1 Tax=Mesobacterium pallidum TaxID=2872037 RepID=UPI001EE2A876|nr:hypothetical protein [Mesobacterium pallidum]